MSYAVHLRRNADGVVRVITEDDAWDETADYIWTDGNFGCDCNRALLFARAAGEPDPENSACGETAFAAIKAVLESGEEIELDDPAGEGLINTPPPDRR